MPRSWITNSSTHVEAMVNSFNAACDDGFVPDHVYLVESPGVEEPTREAIGRFRTIVEAYGSEEPEIHRTELDDEIAFDRIQAHHTEAIDEANDRGDDVAVDITPGRKFMSAIAFAAGMRYGADHVYYFYVGSDGYRGLLYPELPRTAVRLVDFAEGV